MWVKICANTSLADAEMALEAGADAVGFVFARSKRQVTVAQVAAITARLPGRIERIGVFDSQDAGETARAALESQLSAVQLHIDWNEELVRTLRTLLPQDVEVIPTLHWSVDEAGVSTASEIGEQLKRIEQTGLVRRVLIDSKVNGASGGTGIAFDWGAAARIFSAAPAELKLILAGGLTPGNVSEAVAGLCPFGVDVASGVEASVGRKDRARVADFIAHARAAEKPWDS